MLRLDDITHSYNGRRVIDGITVELAERRIGVIGANGSGKSTMARMLNGLVIPDSGRVLVEGRDTRKDAKAIRRRVGFVFSDADTQIIMPTVAEDVEVGLRRSGLSAAEIADRVDGVLRAYGLDGHRDHPAHLLSSGQKQLLALASVLVTDPAILVCDEPTTLLDLRNTAAIERRLSALPQQVVLLTHHLHMLAGYDRVLVLDEGRIAFDGAPDDAVAHYTELMAPRGGPEPHA
ncbi:biotin transport system ATP-binding protein [Murinocardiopsis flavida]|uniref:Biotin transport system ATP-binding protein n=1 Tax=Murinocardiopsis flavida TaxID=645275 RepID=A0A2P8D596_9ACTN|nr:ABC transporter ATP-binding protein [Murinocardiopsis flavida]PSK92381.1 biotin transport system ATP-binding protein [Murinocardiopsis flavida]